MFIQTVELSTANLAAQSHFYSHVLGLPMVASSPEQAIWQCGASQLILRQGVWHGVAHFAFNIPENRFAEAKAWLRERTRLHTDNSGADEFPFPNWNAHACYFRDADGNILELIARHDLPNAQAVPFTSDHLLSISEVGLIVTDVLGVVAQLQAVCGVEAYKGSSELFTAVGDPHGLLIVVKEGRLWYPDTGQAATLVPVQAQVRNGQGVVFQLNVDGGNVRVTAVE